MWQAICSLDLKSTVWLLLTAVVHVHVLVFRDLFIQLEYGPRRSVDPTVFAKSLQLDHSIQQVGDDSKAVGAVADVSDRV